MLPWWVTDGREIVRQARLREMLLEMREGREGQGGLGDEEWYDCGTGERLMGDHWAFVDYPGEVNFHKHCDCGHEGCEGECKLEIKMPGDSIDLSATLGMGASEGEGSLGELLEGTCNGFEGCGGCVGCEGRGGCETHLAEPLQCCTTVVMGESEGGGCDGKHTLPFEDFIDGLVADGHKVSLVEDYERDPKHGWVFGRAPGMTEECRDKLKAVVLEHKDASAFSMGELPGYCGDMPPFSIRLSHDRPIWTPERKHSVLEKEVMNEKCGELRDHRIIRPSTSTKYSSGVVIAAKKDAVTGEWTDRRFCVDLRNINAATAEFDRYTLPLADDLFDRVGELLCLVIWICAAGFISMSWTASLRS